MKRRPSGRDYPRTARINTLIREILADELERIDDERLDLVSLTDVVVDGDLGRAVVYYDHSRGEDAEPEIAEAFTALRVRLQGAVGRQAKLKRTPELRFEPDEVLHGALHIEEVLRTLGEEPPVPPVDWIDPADPPAPA